MERETIEKVAHLARITLEESEIPNFVNTLTDVLALVDHINDVDTQGVLPMAHPFPNMTQRLRPDEVSETVDREALQSQAPDTTAGVYLVPAVIASE